MFFLEGIIFLNANVQSLCTLFWLFSARVNTVTEPVDDANFSAVNAILEEAERDYLKTLTTETIAKETPQEDISTPRTTLNQAEDSSPRRTTTPEVSTTSRGTSTEEEEDPRVRLIKAHLRDIQSWVNATRDQYTLILAYAHNLEQWTRSDKEGPPPTPNPALREFHRVPYPSCLANPTPIGRTSEPRVIPIVYPAHAEVQSASTDQVVLRIPKPRNYSTPIQYSRVNPKRHTTKRKRKDV